MGLWLLQRVVVGVAFMVSVAGAQTKEEKCQMHGGCLIIEEKRRMRETNFAMAATLVGALSFIMMLYRATNWRDKDIQKSTWSTIGTTISIFCAVLIFQEAHHLVKTRFTSPVFGDEVTVCVFLVTFVHFIIWVIIALISTAWRIKKLFKDHENMVIDVGKERRMLLNEAHGKCEDHENDREFHRLLCDLELNTEFMGHLLGFAAINTFATFQRLDFFKGSVITAFLATVISTGVMILVEMATEGVREKMSKRLNRVLIPFGKVTEWLRGKMSMCLSEQDRPGYLFSPIRSSDAFNQIWDKQMKEVENDAVTLTVSFLIMQCIRLHITACLPNEEGIEQPPCSITIYDHTFGEKCQMLIVQLVFMVLAFVVTAYYQKRRKHHQEWWKRLSECAAMGCAILFAWSLYYGSQMFLAGWPWLNDYPNVKGENMLLGVLTAVFVSAVGFAFLLLLDNFADSLEEWTDHSPSSCLIGPRVIVRALLDKEDVSNFSRAFRKVMTAVGIAIGISWEKCFDESVEAISDMAGDFGELVRIILCAYCVILLVPSWKNHIKPFLTNEGWLFGYLVNIPELHCELLQNEYVNETERLAKLNTLSYHINEIREILKRPVTRP